MPVIATVNGPSRRAALTAEKAFTAAFSSPFNRTSTSAVRPSREAKRDRACWGALSMETTLATSGLALTLSSCRASAPWKTGSVTGNSRWLKRATTLVSVSAPAAPRTSSAARADSVPSMVPLVRLPPRTTRQHRQREDGERAGEDGRTKPGNGPGQGDEHEGVCSARSSGPRQPGPLLSSLVLLQPPLPVRLQLDHELPKSGRDRRESRNGSRRKSG